MTQQNTISNPTGGSAPKRVLIVEDDDAVASLYGRVLRNPQYELSRASSGEEALSLCAEAPFDAIVSDLVMPGMSGSDLLRSVRERDEDVSFVIVTGRPAVESAIAAVECGAMRYLVKPVLPRELRDTVARALEVKDAKRSSREARRSASESETHASNSERDFREALESLYMMYQPILSLSQKSVFGYEALVRTRHPRLSQPREFLEAAARAGGFQELGRQVRRAVAGDIEKLPPGCLVFVNLHAEELLDEALYSDANPLRKHTGRIVFELTEQGQVEGIERRITALRERNFLIAVDDLGAGYAALSLLVGLEPDIVKIDRDLVRGVDSDPSKKALITSLATVCRQLEIGLVCEGVETEAEGRCLLEVGVELLQGYFFAKPQITFPPQERKRLVSLMEDLHSRPTGIEEGT
jgi:EAL domain-containing protein (putative c-di-GMP-specific phosphodiesterase class I)/CheY-like chemotaxis protein